MDTNSEETYAVENTQRLSSDRFVPADSTGFHSCPFVSMADVASLGNVVELNCAGLEPRFRVWAAVWWEGAY